MVVTLRLPESIGKAAEQLAEKDRRKLSSYLSLIIEDAIKEKLAEQTKPKGRKIMSAILKLTQWRTFQIRRLVRKGLRKKR